jgi:hypothetical protein
VQRNSDKVCTPALTISALWVRVYDLLPVALSVKQTTILAFTNSLKASFLVKRKPLVCLVLLPVSVSHVTNAQNTSEDAVWY